MAAAVAGPVALPAPLAPAAAQITIDQTVLDRLGPPRREAPPAAPGPGMAGLSLAPAEGQLVARPRQAAAPARRAHRPRAARAPLHAPTAVAAPAIGPEPQADPPARAGAQAAAPILLALPVPPEFVPPPPPPPLPAPPERPAPPELAAAPAAPTPPSAPAARALPPAQPTIAAPAAPPPAAPPVATQPAPALAAPALAAGPPAASPGRLKLAFQPGDSTLSAEARSSLAAFARELPPDDAGPRVVILGYGDDPEGDTSRARRLALARAIEARAVLLAAGVRSTRIDVRALGRPTDASDPDRVEVSLGPVAVSAPR